MAIELAKAYVQIIPSAKGISGSISQAISPGLNEAGEQAGKTIGSSLVGKLKAVVTVAGIGKTIAASISEGAELEQSIGGIETLFKDSYSKVEQYANQAYKTAGLSANDYMQQVTSFSASLLQSLDGDTNRAAESANQALVDMSDNANKMGTSIELIQNAYQGFAKQNYTMLDNLKLGYGGTKEEMQRLLLDAQKLTGVKYDINNLNDVYQAIHAVQENLGITGTTAKEAETTFTGSFNSMKAALGNFLATLSLGKKGTMTIQKAMSDLISTAINFLLNNALPMLINIITTFPTAIFAALDGFSIASFSEYLSKLFLWINTFITQKIPEMVLLGINSVVNFVNGLMQSIPNIINGASTLITNLVNGMMEKMPAILETAAQAVLTFVTGIIENLPEIISAAVNLVTNFLSSIVGRFPEIVETGVKLIGKLLSGIIKSVPNLLAKIPGIISDIVNGFSKIFSKMDEVGKNLVKGLWNGIKSVKDWVLDKIKGFGESILDVIKSFFGINSPSKLMRDQVGIFLAEGIGVGFAKGMNSVSREMEKSIPQSFNVISTIEHNHKTIGLGRGKRMISNEKNDIAENIIVNVYSQTNVDGTPLMEKSADYTIKKITKEQKGSMLIRGQL